MSITIRDCLQLPSLSLGKVIAGHNGLDNIVNTVSVVEFDDYDDSFCTPNELLITAFYSKRDNVNAQCVAIQEYKKSGDVGIVLFYSNQILKTISPQLIEVSNRLSFPIIAIPGENIGIRYSDVISDVMEAIFIDRKTNNFFVNNTMERISQLTESNRNITTVLSFASEYAKASFFLCDEKKNLIAASYWPFTNKMDSNLIFNDYKESGYSVYKMPFIKNGTELTLFAASKNGKLNNRIMNEVIEVIQLFVVIWNYNLNISTRESLIPALLESDRTLIETISSEQKIDISSLNAMMFVDLDIDNSKLKLRQQIALSIKNIICHNCSNGIVDLFGNLVVIINSQSKDSTRYQLLENDIISYVETIKEPLYYTVFSGLDLSLGVKELYLKYCSSINTAKKIYPLKTFFTYSEIIFSNKCKNIIDSMDNEKEEYIKMLRPIIEDSEEDLLLTLSTYMLDAGSEVKKTAELLFVHRNTVQYRLSKIKSLMNLDFSKMPMYYDVYLSAAILRASMACSKE